MAVFFGSKRHYPQLVTRQSPKRQKHMIIPRNPSMPARFYSHDAYGHDLQMVVTPEEELEFVYKRHPHLQVSNPQNENDQVADEQIDQVQLWTTDESDRMPTIAYLTPLDCSISSQVPCLRIGIEEKKVTNEKGHPISKKVVELAVGYCPRELLERCEVKVTAKQTKKQCWLTDIWSEVDFRLRKKAPQPQDEGTFAVIEHLNNGEIENSNIARLLMMMSYEFWVRKGVSEEASNAFIASFGIIPDMSRAAFGTKLRRSVFSI